MTDKEIIKELNRLLGERDKGEISRDDLRKLKNILSFLQEDIESDFDNN